MKCAPSVDWKAKYEEANTRGNDRADLCGTLSNGLARARAEVGRLTLIVRRAHR
jgi:hypothetical protein